MMKRVVVPLLRPSCWLVLAQLFAGCAGVTKPVYTTFPGRFVDHRTLADPSKDVIVGSRERRSFDGHPHRESELGSLGAWSIMPATDLKAYLDGIVDALLATIDQPGFVRPDIEVFAISTPYYEAWTTPYQDIFLSLGTLQAIESEDELAFILGHEIGHVILNHFNADSFNQARDSAVQIAGELAILSVTLANSDINKDASGTLRVQVEDEREVGKNAAIAVASYMAFRELTGTLYDPHGNRNQEDEADLIAMDLMVRAGYSPAASLTALERLQGIELEKEQLRQQRLSSFSEMFGTVLGDPRNAGDTDALADRAVAVGTQQLLTWAGNARERMRSTHRMVAERTEAMRGYYMREYRGKPAPVAAVADSFHERVWSGDTKKILDNHASASQADEQLRQGNVAEAERLALAGIAAPTVDAPYTRYVMYQVRKAQGSSFALENLQFVESSPFAPPVVIQAVAEEYLALRRPNDSLRVLDSASGRFGTRKPFLPSYVGAFLTSGDQPQLSAAVAECNEVGGAIERRCQERLPQQEAAQPQRARGGQTAQPTTTTDDLIKSVTGGLLDKL